ncbi:MAG: hypothetical protein ABSD67_15460 [Terracidiphilus sp.]
MSRQKAFAEPQIVLFSLEASYAPLRGQRNAVTAILHRFRLGELTQIGQAQLERRAAKIRSSGRITAYAEISAEPNLFKKIHAITDSTESAQEFLTFCLSMNLKGFWTPLCIRARLQSCRKRAG